MRRLPLRAAALVATAGLVALAPVSGAAVKPALTLVRGGSVSTSGTLMGMDSGHNFTPTECGAELGPAHPFPNSGQCDVIPVSLKYPATIAPDFKFSVTATLTYTQVAPPMSMQVCLFKRGDNDTPSCAGGATTFGSTLVVTMPLDASTRALDAVVDQRIGYNNPYKLTLKWADLNTPTKLTGTAAAAGSTSTLTARLMDERGRAVAGQAIQWRTTSKTLATTKTDAGGFAKLTKVARGQKITVTYGGSAKYTSASTTIKT